VPARIDTLGLDVRTPTIVIHENSLAAVERELAPRERLIARDGTPALFGELDVEPPRRSAKSEAGGTPQPHVPDASCE
jgi:hypothetical protein